MAHQALSVGSTSSYEKIVKRLRSSFMTQKTFPLAWRREQLKQLDKMLLDSQDALLDALYRDLKKSAFEAYTGDIGFARAEIRHALKNLSGWMRAQHVFTPLVYAPATSKVCFEPRGVVLIIGPWNYPIQLLLCPLAAAIAAGNCAVLKPSEFSEHTSEVLATILPKYLDQDCFSIVLGGVDAAKQLVEQRFDHIFFTGSTRVGRSVMENAARNLTPVTLELGGKSPAIVDQDSDVQLAAKRIAWGKFMNVGQTCIAPDYVLVHQQAEQQLLSGLKKAIEEFYGSDPRESPDYGRIVNRQHMVRLASLLEKQNVYFGGEYDVDERYFSPTILANVRPESMIMQEEIFGPILPIVRVKDVDEAINFVNEREKPLALYLFSNNRRHQKSVLKKTSSGGLCFNDTISHCGVPGLPFGGVGQSGMGAYRGEAGFKNFSHQKSVMTRSTIDIPLRYPPFGRRKLMLARWFQ